MRRIMQLTDSECLRELTHIAYQREMRPILDRAPRPSMLTGSERVDAFEELAALRQALHGAIHEVNMRLGSERTDQPCIYCGLGLHGLAATAR